MYDAYIYYDMLKEEQQQKQTTPGKSKIVAIHCQSGWFSTIKVIRSPSAFQAAKSFSQIWPGFRIKGISVTDAFVIEKN